MEQVDGIEPTLSVLVVEDDPDDARITFRALRRSGRYTPVHVRTATDALRAVAAGSFCAYLVDYRLPDMSGVELCRRLRAMGVDVPLIMLSSVQSDQVAERAFAAGAADFLVKSLLYGEGLEAEISRVMAA